MTNNPTIDGVSRELLRKWRRDLDACQRVIWLAGGFDPAYCTDAQECIAQMDSVLDAPPVEVINSLREHCKQCAEVVKTWPEWKRDCLGGVPAVERQDLITFPRDLTDEMAEAIALRANCCGGIAYDVWEELVRCIEKPKHPDIEVCGSWPVQSEDRPRLSDLQSTIAQLQAEQQLLQSTVARYLDRIAELESGRGEVVYQVSDGVSGWRDVERLKFTACQLDPEEYECRILFDAPPLMVTPDKYDDVLLPFLALMRAELHANAHKGDRPGWLQMDSKTAILEVFYHMGKLHQAVHRGEEAAIKEYAADVANMCMMLLDVCDCLDATAALNGERK